MVDEKDEEEATEPLGVQVSLQDTGFDMRHDAHAKVSTETRTPSGSVASSSSFRQPSFLCSLTRPFFGLLDLCVG